MGSRNTKKCTKTYEKLAKSYDLEILGKPKRTQWKLTKSHENRWKTLGKLGKVNGLTGAVNPLTRAVEIPKVHKNI